MLRQMLWSGNQLAISKPLVQMRNHAREHRAHDRLHERCRIAPPPDGEVAGVVRAEDRAGQVLE